MKRLVLLFVLLAAPAFAQEVVPDLRSARAAYPTPMTPEQISDLLNRVAAQHPGWGMLRKDAGNRCPTPYPGVSISCDWMVHAAIRYGYDILKDQEGVGEIVESGGAALSPGQEIVYPWPVGGQPTPTPTPQPVPMPQPPPAPPPVQTDLSPVLTRLDDLSAQSQRVFDALVAQLAAHDERLKQHDENPSYFTKIFGNRYVQMVLAGVGTWIGQKAAK